MALIYIGFGFFHLVFSDGFLPIMPPILPFPREIVWFTGVCEIAGGFGLVTPALRRWAGIGLALYAIWRVPGQPLSRLWACHRAGPAVELVVSRAAPAVSAGVRLVGALGRRGDRLAILASPPCLRPRAAGVGGGGPILTAMASIASINPATGVG